MRPGWYAKVPAPPLPALMGHPSGLREVLCIGGGWGLKQTSLREGGTVLLGSLERKPNGPFSYTSDLGPSSPESPALPGMGRSVGTDTFLCPKTAFLKGVTSM